VEKGKIVTVLDILWRGGDGLLARTVLLALAAIFAGVTAHADSSGPAPELQSLRALSRHHRVDLVWEQGEALFFEIERRGPGESEFRRINKRLWTTNVYGDYIGNAEGLRAYRVRAIYVSPDGESTTVSDWSRVVEAAPRESTEEEFLTEIQEASFRYFYDWRHPVSGLAREKTPPRVARGGRWLEPRLVDHIRDMRQLCTTGATGMGMFNLVVGVERGFITREEGTAWALQMLRFLSTKAERFHGAFSHWLYGDTGKTRPFAGREDNGADSVETSFLASGFIVLREYFTGDKAEEREIRELADSLWRDIEWDWFSRGVPDGPLYWHWSPDYGWAKNHPVRGFNESAILYVLGLASPTHPIDLEAYHKGWRRPEYGEKRNVFGVTMSLGQGLGPPLFWTHYSYLGLDPRAIHYDGASYFEHFKRFCEVQVRYAQSKRDTFKGYGPLWGLTSSANPNHYKGHRPGEKDDGTIAPTAALSSMPYLPEASQSCLRILYNEHGRKLWKDYGFTDAFNYTKDWIAPLLLGIDAGPIAPMIENHRTGLCWTIFMKAPEVQAALARLDAQ